VSLEGLDGIRIQLSSHFSRIEVSVGREEIKWRRIEVKVGVLSQTEKVGKSRGRAIGFGSCSGPFLLYPAVVSKHHGRACHGAAGFL
jgi:hypothetical protein